MKNRRRALAVVNVRIPAEHVAKLGWIAAEKSQTVAEILRGLVAHAVRGARAPLASQSREILASDEEWERWDAAAARLNTTPGALAAKLLARVAERQG